MDEVTRYSISNDLLRNAKGEIDKSTLKDFDTQIKYLTRALQSATNDVVKVTKNIDEVTGLAVATFDIKSSNRNALDTLVSAAAELEGRYAYKPDFVSTIKQEEYRTLTFHKTLAGKDAQKKAKDIMEDLAGSAVLDPTHHNKDRMLLSYPVSEKEYQDRLAKSGSEEKVREFFARRLATTLKDATSKSKFEQEERTEKEQEKKAQEELAEKNKQERREQAEKRKQERIEAANRTKTMHTLALIVTVLTAVADITRRILTATLSRATETRVMAADAKAIGITQEQARQYTSSERALGLPEGTIVSAFKQVQDALGDISNANEQTLRELAKVLQSDTQALIEAGMGKSDPERVTATILKDYFNRAQQGINSLGLQVGQYQAERELATALEKAGLSELATVLRNMFYVNDTGIYRGQIGSTDPFADYSKLTTAYTFGLTPLDYKQAAELGQVVDALNNKFMLLKENIETKLLLALNKLLGKIDNIDIGKSPEEKIKDEQTRIESNEQAIQVMGERAALATASYEAAFAAAGIDFKKLGFANSTAFLKQFRDSGAEYWKPQTQEAASEYGKLITYLNTPEGMETLRLIQVAETARLKKEQAQAALEKGRKTGKTYFEAADYTETAFQQETKDLLTGTTFSKESAAVNLLRRLQGNNAYQPFYSDELIYNKIIESFYGGKPFTYEEALKQGDAKLLTSALYSSAEEAYKSTAQGEAVWKQMIKKYGLVVSDKEKQEAVKTALASNMLTQEDVNKAIAANINKIGIGIPTNYWGLAKDALIAEGKETFAEEAGAISVINEIKNLQQAKEFIATNTSDIKATISDYNQKTGEVIVTLVSKTDESVNKIFSLKTDAILGTNTEYEYDLGTQALKARQMSTAQ